MRWTTQLIRTEKPDSGRTLMERAGLVRHLSARQCVWLSLGWRIVDRLRQLVEDSFQEYHPTCFHHDGDERNWWQGIVPLITSHRQLPQHLCHATLPAMMELWCIHAQPQDMTDGYGAIRAASMRMWPELGLRPLTVQTTHGHSAVAPSDHGAFDYLASDRGNFAATASAVSLPDRPWSFGTDPAHELETVATPGASTIEQVCRSLDVSSQRVLKTRVYRALYPPETAEPPLANLTNPRWVVVVVRGDHTMNEHKVRRAARELFHIEELSSEIDDAMRRAWAIGFVGPDAATRIPDAVMLIDPDAANGDDYIAGANRADHHVRHFNWFREAGQLLADPNKVAVVDLRNAVEGDPSPRRDGGTLHARRGIEMASLRQPVPPRPAYYTDADGQRQTLLVTSATIYVQSMIQALAEHGADEHGLVWPIALAPAPVVITPVQYRDRTRQVADALYEELRAANIEVLLDDRTDIRAGEKFADADLIGIPLRITVGERGLNEGKVEIKHRTRDEPEQTPIDQVTARIGALLSRPNTAP